MTFKDPPGILIKYPLIIKKFLDQQRRKLGFLLIDVPELESKTEINFHTPEDTKIKVDPKIAALREEVLEALERLENMDIDSGDN